MNKYSESLLPNGLKVITSENLISDVVTVSVWVKCGARYEDKEQSGYSHLIEHVISKGTKKRPTSFAVHVEKDRVGAYYNAWTGSDYIYFVIQVTRKHIEKMFDWLSDIILNPLFDEEILANEIKVVREEIGRNKENYEIQSWKLSTKIFFENHPLANDPVGEEETITKVRFTKLREYYNNFFIPQNAAIITSGNLTHAEAAELTKKYFGGWRGELESADKFFKKYSKLKNHYWFEKAKTNQSYIVLNYLAPDASTIHERATLDILSNYLSYGHSSLLKQELRNKRGLVYGISTFNLPYNDAGRFAISTSTMRLKETAKVLIDTVENLSRRFTEDLLGELKEQLISVRLRLSADQFNDIIFLGNNFILYNKLINLEESLESIKQVNYQDIFHITKEYFKGTNRLLFVLGSEDINIEY